MSGLARDCLVCAFVRLADGCFLLIVSSSCSFPRTAEERQDRNDKRRRIDADNRKMAESRTGNTHVQNGHDYVPVRPALPPAAPGLPSKPEWVAGGKKSEDVASMVGSNQSIVANRKAIRMANLSAAEMIKAEMAGLKKPGGEKKEVKLAKQENLSAAEKLKRELKGETEEVVEEEEEEKPVVETEEEVKIEEEAVVEEKTGEEPAVVAEEDVKMATAAEDETEITPRGTKRKAVDSADASANPWDDEEEAPPTVDVDAFIATAVAEPEKHKVAPLKDMGNNVVEQEDTVKCVPSAIARLSTIADRHLSRAGFGNLDTRSDTTDRSLVSNSAIPSSDDRAPRSSSPSVRPAS